VLSRFRSILQSRSYRYLVSACTVTALGDRLTHMLLITLIALAKPGKVLAYSQGALVFSLPPILFAPVVGVLIDRWDKRRVLSISHFAQGGLLLLAPILILLTHSLTPVWVTLFLFFTVDIFDNSTAPAMLPAVVKPDEIVAANSIWSIFTRAAAVIGMVAGGYLVRWVGWKWGSALDGMTHIVSALLVLGIVPSLAFRPKPDARRPELGPALSRSFQTFFHQLGEVFRLIGRNRYVAFVMFSIVVSVSISGIAYAVLLFLVQQVMNLGTPGVGIYTGILAAGMILGAVSVGLFGERIPKTRIIVIGIALLGLMFVGGAFLINIWFIGIVALVAGLVFSSISIAQTSILQTKVSAEIQGRIFATREFFNNTTFMVVAVVIGLISLVTILRSLLVVVGAILLVLAGVGLWLVRGLDEEARGSGTEAQGS
jgi:MFS family permease